MVWPISEDGVGGGTAARRNISFNTEFHEEKYSDSEARRQPFEIDGTNFTFAPHYYPEQVTVTKQRDLIREKSICRGEYVNDVGTLNREIHVVGYIRSDELKDYHYACDYGEESLLICMPWQGEVLVEDTKLEGPVGVDAHTGHYLYEYTIDLVSTGVDELGMPNDGILHDGSSDEPVERTTPGVI